MGFFYTTVDMLYAYALQSTSAVFSFLFDESEAYSQVVPDTEMVPLHSEDERHTFKSVDVVLRERTVSSAIDETCRYVATPSAPLFQNPTHEFDGIRAFLVYGAAVIPREERGRFIRVTSGDQEGWMMRDDLQVHRGDVYPVFIVGKENEVDDPNTIRLRAIINDMFGGTYIEYPLQAGEYVMYRLLQRGVQVAWPPERPRVPGRWHHILRGVAGVHIGVVPKTGSVMEYMMQNEMGHVAYVDAVSPDGTITISETNYPDRGVYNERVLKRESWIELHPVFIELL